MADKRTTHKPQIDVRSVNNQAANVASLSSNRRGVHPVVVPTTEPKTPGSVASIKSNQQTKIIAQTFEHHRTKKEAARLMQKYAKDAEQGIDREQFRKILRDLDPHGREALPSTFEWAWSLGNQNNTGTMGKEELGIVLTKYSAYQAAHPHIEELIREFDADGNGVMDEFEMKNLLERVSGKTITRNDVTFVLKEVKTTAQKRIKGKFDEKMSTDPDILSRAIATWWFHRDSQGNDFLNSPEDFMGSLWQQVSNTPPAKLPTKEEKEQNSADPWGQFWNDFVGCSLQNGLCVREGVHNGRRAVRPQ